MVRVLRRAAPLLIVLFDLACKADSPHTKKTTFAAPAPDTTRAELPEAALPAVQRPGRQPGPPRPASPEQLAQAQRESHALLRALLDGGIPKREAASVADIRGYRLYRQRHFSTALIWFKEASQVDPTFELSLYNAARCASLLADHAAARRYLQQLSALKTPLARAHLNLARHDPDFTPVP